ncbi:hypothetical protein [Saccharomonospora marina]
MLWSTVTVDSPELLKVVQRPNSPTDGSS